MGIGEHRQRRLKMKQYIFISYIPLHHLPFLKKFKRDGKVMAVILGTGIEGNFIFRLKH